MKEYTIDNIGEFFSSLDNSVNENLKKFMVWAGWNRDRKRQEKECDACKNYDWYGCRYAATIVGEDIVIVEEIGHNDTTNGFYAVVDNDASHNLWHTFDQALLCALSIKYTGDERATVYAKRVLNMEAIK